MLSDVFVLLMLMFLQCKVLAIATQIYRQWYVFGNNHTVSSLVTSSYPKTQLYVNHINQVYRLLHHLRSTNKRLIKMVENQVIDVQTVSIDTAVIYIGFIFTQLVYRYLQLLQIGNVSTSKAET